MGALYFNSKKKDFPFRKTIGAEIFDKEKFRLVVLISVFVRTFYLFVRTPLHFFSHNTHKYAAKGVNFLKMVESLWVFLGQFWHM